MYEALIDHGLTACLHRFPVRAALHGRPERRLQNTATSHCNMQQRCSANFQSASQRVSLVCCSEKAATIEAEPTGGKVSSIPTSSSWELDFSSRPILDERGKKVWELLVTDSKRNFEYWQFLPNNKINSTQLKQSLQELLDQEGAVPPKQAKFFRGQMQTIISRALTELNIKPVPSRRCHALQGWIEERNETVYKKDPGYSSKAVTSFQLDLGSPQDLPDALRGEKWSFVQLPLGELYEELEAVDAGVIYGDNIPFISTGAAELSMGALIPGVAVFSRRAEPLAAWTSAYELAAIVADSNRAGLILETGVNQRWRYGSYRQNGEQRAEALAWEEAKKAVRGLHFLAIQDDEESEACAGIWLLQDRQLTNL